MQRCSPLLAILFIFLPYLGNGARRLFAADNPGWLLPPGVGPEDATVVREGYVPQPGDLVFYSSDKMRQLFFYALAHTGKPYHSGIVVNLPDGRPALLEAGPYDFINVYLMDLLPRLRTHEGAIWVRRRRTPLTADQSARLTRFALAQTGKHFAVARIMLEVTPLHAHGTLHRRVFGSSRVDRRSWFCSELVVAALAVAGVVDPQVMKPNTIYPRDLFYDRPFDLKPCWEEPRRWTCAP